jgi:hypothetical protein
VLPGFDLFAPGSGFSFAPSAASRSGDVGGSSFGGIQSGGQGVPVWIFVVAIAIGGALLLRRVK